MIIIETDVSYRLDVMMSNFCWRNNLSAHV